MLAVVVLAVQAAAGLVAGAHAATPPPPPAAIAVHGPRAAAAPWLGVGYNIIHHNFNVSAGVEQALWVKRWTDANPAFARCAPSMSYEYQ